MAGILMSKQGRSCARLMDRLVTMVGVLVILQVFELSRMMMPRATPRPQFRSRISPQLCSALSR